MSRLYFTIIILLAAGVLVLGMTITADALEDLGAKPVTVLAVEKKSNHTRVTLLGTDYYLSSELVEHLLVKPMLQT